MPALPTLIGRYQIKSLIGRGGMGSLYLAHDPNTGRLVTIKVLNATLDSVDLRERFGREARALAALNQPNIVNIYDSGEFEGSPFIVMEYVRGETLDEVIHRRAPMPVSQKLKLMEELCAGLAHAHEAGIIHRDIKPANLMVDQQGHLKILDFGIAHVAESSNKMTRVGVPLTQINMTIGTPGYMSPEQIDGREVDHRSDIFAVGAVCYELLSYSVAFEGTNTRAIERKVLQSRPVGLATLMPDLDPEIDEIVQRAMKKDPNKRFQDAGTFERALERVRARLGPEDVAAPGRRPTPPSLPTRGKVNQARAEAAYQRAAAALAEGSLEAARRFAAEALAEDSSHVQARALLAGLDPRPSTASIPPTARSQDPVPPTMVGTSVGAGGMVDASPTIIVPPSAHVPRQAHVPPRNPAPPKNPAPKPHAAPASQRWQESLQRALQQLPVFWKRHRMPIVAAAAVFLAVLVVSAAAWMFLSGPSGELLTIAKPVGGTISGAGINCGTRGGDCTVRRPAGEIVELTIVPDDGFAFESYIGDCAPGGRTIMTGPRNCGVTFAAVVAAPPAATQLLTISPVPAGGTLEGVDILCGTKGTVCSANHPEGVPVELRQTADAGFTFMGFTGDCTPLGQTQMAGPRTCSAKFSPTAEVIAAAPIVPTRPATPKPQPPPPSGVGATSTSSAPGPAPTSPVSQPTTPTTAVNITPGASRGTPPADQGPVTRPPTDEEYAKGKIVELLKGFCGAFEALDPAAVQQLYPKADLKQLEIQLNRSKYKSVLCSIGEPTYVALDAIKGTARVRVETKRVFVHTFQSAKPDTQELIATLQLVRADPRSPWLIDKADYMAKPK